jgi:hypothetical protein
MGCGSADIGQVHNTVAIVSLTGRDMVKRQQGKDSTGPASFGVGLLCGSLYLCMSGNPCVAFLGYLILAARKRYGTAWAVSVRD